MGNEVERLKAQIRYRLVNLRESVLHLVNGKIDLKLSLSDEDYRYLLREAVNKNISKEELIKLIEGEREGINLDAEINYFSKVMPSEIPLGQHVKLITSDETGEAIEELVYLGDNNFVLIYHERNSLHLNDILRSRTSPWNTGAYIDFEVYRNYQRVIVNEKLSIYRTRIVSRIAFLNPQIDYDKLILDKEKYDNTDNPD